jgi:hypothetical protein
MAEKVDDYEFSPGHPSYYKQGKPALKPEDIPAMDTSKDDVPSPCYIGGNPIRIPKNPGDKRTERLLEAKKAYEEELDKDVKKYKKYVKLYETMPTEGADEINPLSTNLSLKHNHICYHKGWVERIERELAGIITSNKQLTLNI